MKGGGRCSSREDKEACNGDRRHNVVCRNYRCAFHSHLSQSSQHLPFVALVVITTPLVRNAFHPADLPSSPTVVVRGNSEPGDEDLDPEENEVDSFNQHIDNLFATSEAQRRQGCKTPKFWNVNIIDSDDTINHARLIVREAMKQPKSRKIILKFNNKLQPIGDEGGLLSGVLGLLGADDVGEILAPKERIVDIEQHDESSRVLSQNDLLVQTLGIEHWVVCMAWVMDRLLLGDEVQIEETQRMLLELQIEVATEKLK
ncbi:hypothetical protein Ahy_B01g056554 isoform A [Arachis hypogaea]|uniref:Uncharacterized protein n=1 Tax=Arachis hypogaea TaxID=3818 RepID=A0A445AZ19_ARAHY|nr:hypothetical protein Ahy_B01g056554 isoform A [Arachis hypogaea]